MTTKRRNWLRPGVRQGARRVARRIRRTWELHRPIPLPRFVSGTPRIDGDLIDPNPETLGAAAMSEEAALGVSTVLDRLTPSQHSDSVQSMYRKAREKFGSHWRYADVLTALWAAATFLKPKSYLEIGMLRGRSASVVGSIVPDCAIYGFDLWIEGYAGGENPGPDFVRNELRTIGHRGEVAFTSGDSKATVPAFLDAHPGLYFDLINVDGDHSVMGAAIDLANTLPRLKVGGIVVMDDVRWSPALLRVWQRAVKQSKCFASWEYLDAGFGIAVAIRTLDIPYAQIPPYTSG
ncbi:MAG: class I SAM-dependent methyltransferase [Vicinamibacterales bacterium]